jgi:hypothetical protein
VSDPTYGVVLLPSTSQALRGEKVLLQAGVRVKLIPTPRQFSSECGLALRFDWAEREQVEATLAASRVVFDRIVSLAS